MACDRPLGAEALRAYSSVGESARLISVRSVVQIYLGPPSRGLAKAGGIAQLEEHLLCKQGVSGSNPLTSTKR